MISDPAAIWIDIADHVLAERCLALLHSSQVRVWTDLDALPPGTRIDVVISTRTNALRELGLTAEPPVPDVGLLLIGRGDPPAADAPAADAGLPADFADRELLLACRLLAQIVRWRREALHTAETRREFERLALTDALTNLPNRRAWDLELPRRLQAAHSAGQSVCVTMLDVDRFKPVNDSRGHAVGDAVLAAVGRGLSESLRTTDVVARLGGDEFGLLLVGTFDSMSAAQIVERVRARVMQGMELAIGQKITISAGCAIAERGATFELAHLAEMADTALREAKQAGRNRMQTVLV